MATRNIATAYCDEFEIGRLENKLRYDVAIAPHLHTYYEVFWSIGGTGAHYIDFVSYQMAPNTLFFVAPGQVHYSDISRCNGYALFFTEAFLLSHHLPKSFLLRLPFYQIQGQEQAIYLNNQQVKLFQSLFSRLEQVYLAEVDRKEELLQIYLQALLLEAERLYVHKPVLDTTHPSSLLIQRFKELIEIHFASKTLVKEYAQLLHVTANHLNATTKQLTGETAGELIRSRILLEAKRLLVHSQLSITQIAHQLNFPDPSYFGRFFRKYTAQTPGDFRDSIRKKYQNLYK